MMMDILISSVSRAANLTTEQATLAVAAMLRFFTARLPSALVGELHARLESASDPVGADPVATSSKTTP